MDGIRCLAVNLALSMVVVLHPDSTMLPPIGKVWCCSWWFCQIGSNWILSDKLTVSIIEMIINRGATCHIKGPRSIRQPDILILQYFGDVHDVEYSYLFKILEPCGLGWYYMYSRCAV